MPNIVPLSQSVPLLLTLVTCNFLRLDMKLVASDVKTIFCFRSVCVVMRSDLFWPLFARYQNFLKTSRRTLDAAGKVCSKNKLMTDILVHPK